MGTIKASIYIVTYRNPVDLNNNIGSILASGADIRINVINNHSKFFLEPEHEKSVNVLHNSLRPDFSTGHLARNWNQALLHGFQDLNNPANDIVITAQDDVLFKKEWFSRLVEIHRHYSFVTMGPGDSFCSYLPEAVRKVGLWDERFCNLGYQEADYFLRSLIYNGNGCSINDVAHGRLHNALEGNSMDYCLKPGEPDRAGSLLITTPHWNLDRKDAHLRSGKFHPLSEAVFKHKWGIQEAPWTPAHYSISQTLVPNYIMYPYFEHNVECLREKNYIVPEEAAIERWDNFFAQIAKT